MGQDAVKRVSEMLGLPIGDSFTQDWASEVPEQFRGTSDLQRYVAVLCRLQNPAEIETAAGLVLDVANDLEGTGELTSALGRDPFEQENALSGVASCDRT